MKAFGRYLAYRLKHSVLKTVIFALIALLITQNTVVNQVAYLEPEYRSAGLSAQATVLFILCMLVPMLESAAFKNRRNLDTLYFFPIKRRGMALATYISGFAQSVAVYSVTFFTAWIYLAVKTDCFALQYMFPYYVLSLLVGLATYSFFTFIFAQANTVVDGVLFCSLWFVAPYLIIAALFQFDLFEDIPWRLQSAIQEWGLAYSPINNLTVIFQDLIEINQIGHTDYYQTYAYYYRELWYFFVIGGVVGIASVWGYFVTFVKRGAEKTGEISNSWFGYKTLIPICGYGLMILMGGISVVTFLLIAMMVVGYIIYRRGFRFKLPDYLLTGGALLMAFLGAML